ncbi:DUF2339 domain-containing protein, partial [Desulfobulbus sp. TB]|nr:DUF2339 domain-containing protein [Desulfobulbus sp. TB]
MSTIKTIINMIVGGILFSWIFNDIEGLFVGMALGSLLTRTSAQKKLLQGLEERLEQHEMRLHDLKKGVVQSRLQSKVPEKEQDRKETKEAGAEKADMPAKKSSKSKVTFVPPSSSSTAEPAAPVEKDLISRVIAAVQKFFTEGNVVLRVGLLVLFFGVAFLLKYATENNMISIELRLLGVALAGIILLL